jgi:hypothetical protein
MRLDELFTKPAPFMWEENGRVQIATFMVDGAVYRAAFMPEQDGAYEFAFRYVKDESTKTATAAKSGGGFGKTGTGNEFTVYSTVITILRYFLKRFQPRAVHFVGDRSEGKARLYDKMMKMLAPMAFGMGYELRHGTADDAFQQFEIVRQEKRE